MTEEAALTLAQADMRLSKDGGAFAQKNAAGNATHDSDGWYSTTLNATDTNTVGELILNVHQPANMLPVWMRWWVLEETVYDNLFGASATGYLQPTTAGRTLDVTAGGAAGIDWGNVENPTTAVDLSATDIQLADTVTTLTNKTGFSLSATGLDAIASTATGMVEIAKAIWDRVLTGGTHNIANSAGRRLRFLQESGSYDGAIWIDTVNGAAGTTDFENGTDTNPVDSIADANTLAASLGISRFKIAPGSSITFAAAQTGQMFMGENWTLDLGGQNISNTFIEGANIQASTFTAATGGTIFFQCIFDAAVTMAPCVVRESYLGNVTLTAGSAGNFFFNFCMSRVAGTSTPIFDFGSALNASNLSMRHYSGGIEIQNMGAGTGTYNMSLEGQGNLIINANCSATSNIAIRGAFTLTNNASGMTITDDARLDMPQINAEVDTALADVNLDHLVGTAAPGNAPAGTYLDILADDGTATYDRTTDSLQAIRDRGDAAWTTGGGGSITDLLNVIPLIPEDIDLANTATWRLGLMLTNALDDLPSTAEIDPGTISIDRKAIGGTSWSAVVTDSACSESAGLVYFDEVFDSGTGYAEGDSIRITFKSQKITVSANDYEISDATGRIFYTNIRQTMRGTDSAATASALATVDTNVDAILVDTNELQADWTNGGRLDLLIDAIKAVTDALPDSGALTTIDANVDSILADTGTDGVVISAAQMNSIADHVLRRTWANAEASSDGDTIAFRSLFGAVAKLVNRVAVSGSTLTVYRDDDSTSLGTQAVTTNASADPITEVDTN